MRKTLCIRSETDKVNLSNETSNTILSKAEFIEAMIKAYMNASDMTLENQLT